MSAQLTASDRRSVGGDTGISSPTALARAGGPVAQIITKSLVLGFELGQAQGVIVQLGSGSSMAASAP